MWYFVARQDFKFQRVFTTLTCCQEEFLSALGRWPFLAGIEQSCILHQGSFCGSVSKTETTKIFLSFANLGGNSKKHQWLCQCLVFLAWISALNWLCVVWRLYLFTDRILKEVCFLLAEDVHLRVPAQFTVIHPTVPTTLRSLSGEWKYFHIFHFPWPNSKIHLGFNWKKATQGSTFTFVSCNPTEEDRPTLIPSTLDRTPNCCSRTLCTPFA